MIKKDLNGTFIISAGEVGAYALCPKSWELQSIKNTDIPTSLQTEEGNRLHKEWADNYEETVYLARAARLIIELLILSALIYLLVV